MAWAAPHTYVAGEPLLASQLNQDLYYNMLETMPAKATNDLTDNPLFFYINGDNSIIGRERGYQFIKDVGTRNEGAGYGDLNEFTGPTVTMTTGTTALVMWGCQVSNAAVTGDFGSHELTMTYNVSGATTITGDDDQGLIWMPGHNTVTFLGFSQWDVVDSLTPGVNTFTSKYRAVNVDSPTNEVGEFRWPTLVVIPL